VKATLWLTAGLPEFAPVSSTLRDAATVPCGRYHDTSPGLRSQQDTAHCSPKQGLLSDPVLNTSTDGESTALPCDL